MYISARERKILDILLSHDKGITVGELAQQLNVSNRTVHRDLKGIECILGDYNLQLIKKAGVGIQVTGDEDRKKELQIHLFHLSHTEYTPEERQIIILITLLEAIEPVKLLSLANDLNVTVATISNDLDKISEKIEKHGLSLIRKRGYGVEIAGAELAKRAMMSELLLNHFNEYEFLSLMKESIQKKSADTLNTVTEKLLGLVDKKKLLTIEKQIEDMKDELPFTIADSSYIALVVHLALAIERIIQGEPINFDPQYLETIRATKEFETAEKIARSLERAFHITIPNEEIGYMTMHLMGAKLRDRQGHMLEEASFEVGIKAQELIRVVSDELNIDLTNDYPLYEDLVIHLKPALYRIRHNMGIANPLLEKIVQDYSELFSTLEKGVKKVFPDLTVPKEEIGYLVLHFASALLREKQGLHALVICSSGLGTAKILATRLKNEIPDIAHIEQISVFELGKVDTNQYDLIVSTVPIHNFTEPYFVVSPMLQEDEIASIKQFLKNRRLVFPKARTQHLGEGAAKVIENLSSIQKMSETIVQILNGFTLQELDSGSIQEALSEACRQLYERGIICNAEQVLTELLNREKMGGLGIPETSLALYHTRSSEILLPSFTIYTLTKWQTVKGMHEKQMKVNKILLLLAPESAAQETISVLSHISSLVVKDEESMDVFVSGNKDRLYSFLSHHLGKFFYEHIQYHKE
ncbi:BglG family transcription antiterminator [Thermaerobacillus caldiproteolyticus]|uniref:BglG family transcription antiterminator n=1 Tax=Thermaerobacillus caldiproteolyticus TaxID=247480 RepID=UPI00188CD8D4|nr:BglG family transcription antiterminator [Anoxybacillus caldiproteolyticus]QPA32339.1 BglG family transcription antiterminator [Anoxybacillus caldiproteolyticus]